MLGFQDTTSDSKYDETKRHISARMIRVILMFFCDVIFDPELINSLHSNAQKQVSNRRRCGGGTSRVRKVLTSSRFVVLNKAFACCVDFFVFSNTSLYFFHRLIFTLFFFVR